MNFIGLDYNSSLVFIIIVLLNPKIYENLAIVLVQSFHFVKSEQIFDIARP
jgi:hypothetical protein